MKANRFKAGSGCFTCLGCGKKTRETGLGESSTDLCRTCWNDASWENHHSDNHASGPKEECQECKAEGITASTNF